MQILFIFPRYHDTGHKFMAGVVDTGCSDHADPFYIPRYHDTGHKFMAGVVDTGCSIMWILFIFPRYHLLRNRDQRMHTSILKSAYQHTYVCTQVF
jgi:hypothetical protein